MNLLFGLPLCLLPCSSIFSILVPIYLLSFLCTWQNHLNLAKENQTYLTLPPPVVPPPVVSATVSKPDNIASLITLFLTTPFIFCGYSFFTDHSCIFSPPNIPCLHSLLHRFTKTNQVKFYVYCQISEFTHYLTGLGQTIQMWHPLPLDPWTRWGTI